MVLHGFKTPKQEQPTPAATSRYLGNDNYGRPKSRYLDKLMAMTDVELGTECYAVIYHAARCSNNRRVDWHWQADACMDESNKRKVAGATGIYEAAWSRCVKEHT